MKPNHTSSGSMDWSEQLRTAREDSPALVLGLFAASGELIDANCGLRRVLADAGGDLPAPCDLLVNPTFSQIAGTAPTGDVVFEGLLTLGNRRDPGVTLQSRVYRKADEILVVGHYDVAELARLNDELAQANREVSTLQRVVIQEKRKLEATLAKLRETQAMLVHAEKMNALGQVVAGVAHEINNPIAFVISNMGSLQDSVRDVLEALEEFERLGMAAGSERIRDRSIQILEDHDIAFIRDDWEQLFHGTLDGLERVKKIVGDLRTFSRLDEAERKTVSLAESVQSALAIAGSELAQHAVDVAVSLDHLPAIDCFASELNQVFLNLIVNAIQAMEEGGQLTICGRDEGTAVCVEFADTGHGIPPDIQAKVFDPFFTTKPVGQGTGLGLSLAYKIITEMHQGTISVASEPLQGTTFTIRIPKAART